MIGNLILIATFLLAIGLCIVLYVVNKWNRENDQPSYLQSINNNYKVFCEMMSNKNDSLIQFNFQKMRGLAYTLVVFLTFFKLHNDDRDPCKIRFIKVNKKLECTFISNIFSRRQ